MKIKEIRKLTGLTQKAFAEKYRIPQRTIENWETKNSCASYICDLLEFKVRHDIKQ